MNLKAFEYLYYKIRGYDRETILEKASISSEEYDVFEQTLQYKLNDVQVLKAQADSIGADFVQLTQYIYGDVSDQELEVFRPEAVKPRSGEMISLPAIGTLTYPDISLKQVIEQRRSVRKYSEEYISQEDLSFMLWATSWARDFRTNDKIELTLRNVPSAGARHPFETYLLINRVNGLKPGLYYYHPIRHCIVLINNDDNITLSVCEGCFNQSMVKDSAVTFIWSAVPYRTVWRYGQRGYRYLYLDAGHVGQNLHLAAEAIGNGACMIGAYLDEEMNDIIQVDGVNEFVIYIATVGKKIL